jgi:hypothetical protein
MEFHTSSTSAATGSTSTGSASQRESILYSTSINDSSSEGRMIDDSDMDMDAGLSSTAINNNNNNNTSVNLSLKQQLVLNQFMSITGCCCEQSVEFLTSTNWQYQVSNQRNQECPL